MYALGNTKKKNSCLAYLVLTATGTNIEQYLLKGVQKISNPLPRVTTFVGFVTSFKSSLVVSGNVEQSAPLFMRARKS